PTRIYVDADACPVKDEIYRVAIRHVLPVSVVAGNFIRVPQDPLIERIAAGAGMDAADDWIAERAGKGDIVITSDIPLASRCVKAGAEVIAPNGKPFTEQSIGMTLAVRNLMTDLRSSGEITGGPKSFAPRDRSAFLSALDQTIRHLPQEPDFGACTTTLAYVEAGLGPGDDHYQARFMLEQLGLHGDETPAKLSGGEARRAALARVLAPSPDIMLLDEPTNHLDL